MQYQLLLNRFSVYIIAVRGWSHSANSKIVTERLESIEIQKIVLLPKGLASRRKVASDQVLYSDPAEEDATNCCENKQENHETVQSLYKVAVAIVQIGQDCVIEHCP